MSGNTFAIDARVLLCKNCGAPLSAPVSGGDVHCEYCGTVTRVGARPDLHVSASQAMGVPNAPAPTGDRLFSLHQQAAAYNAASNPYAFYQPPPGLQHVANKAISKGFGDPAVLELTQKELTQALAQAEASPDPLAQRKVFWLALGLAQGWAGRDEFLRERAVLETAFEVLRDPGHRYIVSTELAKAARNLGDLDSAENWLAQLDPEPTILDLDSSYRIAASTVALMRGRPDRALALVGRNKGEIPFDPSRTLVASVVRGAALEGVGDQAAAEATLLQAASEHGRGDVQRVLEVNDSVALARQAWSRLDARGAIPRGPVKVGRGLARGVGGCLGLGIGLPLVITVLAIVFMPVLCVSTGSCFGYQDVVMARLRACPAAVAALGDDIGPAYVGFSCGNAEMSGSSGSASWSMPVKGSRARGRYEFTAILSGGQWRMSSGTLTVDGQMIDVANCAAAPMGVPAMPAMPGMPTPTPQPMPVAPGQPVAPMPPQPAPAPGAVVGSSCDRMAACCAAAGANQHLQGMCRSLPTIRTTPNAEQTCGQLLTAARQVLGMSGGAPPACQ